MRTSPALLDAVNWDFPSVLPGVGTNLHWYPGTFPNALPSTLIEAFTDPGDLVFDPYGGVGTTGFEATRQGRGAFITDANPVATAIGAFSCFLVAAQRLSPMYVAAVMDELMGVVSREENGRQGRFGLTPVESVSLGRAEPIITKLLRDLACVLDSCIAGAPQIDYLAPWFHEKTLQELLAARRALVDDQQSPALKLGGMVMLSANLRAASSQTASWGHVADNVWPKALTQKSVYVQCRTWLARASRILREIQVRPWTGGNFEDPDVRLLNWLHPREEILVAKGRSVNLLITSPPYASAIDYTLSQRLSQYFFGYTDIDVMALVSGEIGARRKRSHSASEEVWATQLASSLELQMKLMRHDGVVCVVLPHKQSGRLLGTVAVESVMKDCGWRSLWTGSRSIRQSRTRQSWTSIQKETLQIFVGGGYPC